MTNGENSGFQKALEAATATEARFKDLEAADAMMSRTVQENQTAILGHLESIELHLKSVDDKQAGMRLDFEALKQTVVDHVGTHAIATHSLKLIGNSFSIGDRVLIRLMAIGGGAYTVYNFLTR